MTAAELLVSVDVDVTDVETRVADLLLVLPVVPMLPTEHLTANVHEAMVVLEVQQESLALLDALVDSRAVTLAQMPVLQRLSERMECTTAHLKLCQFTYDRALSARGKTVCWEMP